MMAKKEQHQSSDTCRGSYMKEYWCIYRITNNVNGKTYIGQHKYTNENNPMHRYAGGGKLLHLAYKKYGRENFSTEVLYRRIQYKETADSMEIWAIAKERKENKNGCYNIAEGGGRFNTGPMSEEHKQKICNANRGRKLTDAHKQKLREANLGKKESEETRRKISKACKGKTCCWKGKKLSEEHRKHISEGNKGKNTWMKGSKASKETIRKRVEKLKGRYFYNNGIEMVFTYECPEGFVPGMIKRRQQ